MKRRRPTGLSLQVAGLAGGAAAITAVLAAGLAYTLARGPAQTQTQNQLHREAVLVRQLFDNRATALATPKRNGALRVLTADRISITNVDPAGAATGGDTAALTAADTKALLAGNEIQGTRHPGGAEVILDGLPLRTGSGGGVVLTEPVAQARALNKSLLRRAIYALAIAVLLAAVAGALLARRITRPLRAVAGSAHALAAGDRGHAVTGGGSAEVAEVAEALTALDAALAGSEARQRDFLLSVSHELRTPLTTIRGFAESLRDGVGTNSLEVADVIAGEAERMERLVGDLLALARLRADRFSLDFREVDAGVLLSEARAAWATRCASVGLAFTGDGQADGWILRTDPDRLRQVLDVLLENAFRLTPVPGTLTLDSALAGDQLALSVSDTGPGLTEDDLTVAFEPGALHARYAGQRAVGSGVGLALAHELTERLGGRLLAASDPGGGARFTAYLPLLKG